MSKSPPKFYIVSTPIEELDIKNYPHRICQDRRCVKMFNLEQQEIDIMLSKKVDENLINILEEKSRHNVVKIRTIKNKRFYIQLCVGSSIAQELGWVDGCSISVESSSTKNFVFLKKIDTTDGWPVKGYIFRRINRSYSYSLKLPCNFIVDEKLKIKTVDHEIIEEKGNKSLKVYLNGRKEEGNR